ncbi:DNA polymerase-3 subunit delta [Methylohalomonas lacus]|uniref:DNA polymerase III subunit delta n=1 Tax=Methylohalomonas lacus TaxID=398773 RepID=A0AAE3HNL7_9GAMM|nr:DNA polymerase III subunit delta [Methylohalomonas lacus]MCS3903962.1 DNA polymerase-3 subunit delta [Methylohalomonas lacus]
MRLKAEQLSAHLRKGLAPVYLVSGDEPLQHMETCDAIRAAARAQGFNERQVLEVERGFNWDSLAQEAAALSLFAEQRLIELRMGSGPGTEGGKVLAEYCSQPPADTILLVSSARIDNRSQQSKWFKAIDQAGVTISVWPVDMAQLPRWISQRCRDRGLNIDNDAAELIAQKVEGNLLAAAQEIEKLRLLTDDNARVDVEAVVAAVADSARYDAFALINSAYNGDLPRALRMLYGLRAEGIEAIAIYGALMWQLRRTCTLAHARTSGQSEAALFKQYRIFDKQQGPFKQIFRRHSATELDRLLHAGGRIDAQLKGYAGGDPWQSLGWLLARLAGYDSLPSMQ